MVPTPSPHSTNKEVPEFSHPGPSLPIQALPFGLFSQYTAGVLGGGKEGLTTTIHQHDWTINASTHQTCLQHTQSLVALCQE